MRRAGTGRVYCYRSVFCSLSFCAVRISLAHPAHTHTQTHRPQVSECDHHPLTTQPTGRGFESSAPGCQLYPSEGRPGPPAVDTRRVRTEAARGTPHPISSCLMLDYVASLTGRGGLPLARAGGHTGSGMTVRSGVTSTSVTLR